MRMPTTPFPFPLKANNPSWGMHPSLSLWGKPVKSPEIMLWVSSNHTLHMPLRDQRLVACLSSMPQELFNTARYNLCTSLSTTTSLPLCFCCIFRYSRVGAILFPSVFADRYKYL